MTDSVKPGGVERLVRRDLLGLVGYQPIVPIEVLGESVGLAPEKVIKLDGNENPYGCSPRVRRALAEYPSFHIYPDPEQRELRKLLEGYAGLSA